MPFSAKRWANLSLPETGRFHRRSRCPRHGSRQDMAGRLRQRSPRVPPHPLCRSPRGNSKSSYTSFPPNRPSARIGRVAGNHRETDADLVFASVQTLGRIPHLSQFQLNDFDYIVIDEFHHAAAGTYRRVIDYFQPKFLLGLTATPGSHRRCRPLIPLPRELLVFEASIREGIDGGHLCSFHYFGIADEIDYSNIPWRNAQFDIAELTAAVATEARARNSLDQFRKHGGRRCIAFCCSLRHADFMADFFARQGVRAVAVHSGP